MQRFSLSLYCEEDAGHAVYRLLTYGQSHLHPAQPCTPFCRPAGYTLFHKTRPLPCTQDIASKLDHVLFRHTSHLNLKFPHSRQGRFPLQRMRFWRSIFIFFPYFDWESSMLATVSTWGEGKRNHGALTRLIRLATYESGTAVIKDGAHQTRFGV